MVVNHLMKKTLKKCVKLRRREVLETERRY
jgi:hypothetical protein